MRRSLARGSWAPGRSLSGTTSSGEHPGRIPAVRGRSSLLLSVSSLLCVSRSLLSFCCVNIPALNLVCVLLLLLQDPAVQRCTSEAELLRDGEPVRSVSGGLPQGLPGERGQTTVAQRLDAGQVSTDVPPGLSEQIY